MHLSRILLYPIKSLPPLEVREAEVTAMGILRHDRRWALADPAGNYIHGKRTPALHQIRTSYSPDLTEVTLTAGAHGPARFPLIEASLQPLASWFTRVLGQRVVVIEDREQGFPDDLKANGPTLVSEASLQTVGDWFGWGLEEVRYRFRTNLEVAGAPPFWEDRLCDATEGGVLFRVGSVELQGCNPCQRCGVPSRNPMSGEATPGFQGEFSRRREEALPSWAEPALFNHHYRFALNTRVRAGQAGSRIRVGDPVVLPGLQP
ncbi:MAG TPA: MOSC domain-containing protein [Verrucomicrobiales bacterium]|nr:MOSC domain-containing protein [Verrucomicrobiales bacterium]